MTRLHHPEEFKLSNGVPVIFQHYEGPVAASYWWNNVGSADELPFQSGFSHFLEHMLFKDTDAKNKGGSSQGELARAIESLGGDINAYTSLDQTVYHVTCAEQHWEKILKAFAGMAKPQKFSKKDFNSEREVILEELKKNEDSPSRMLFQELFNTLYKSHPYRRPVIGYVKTLKAAKVQQLMDYYQNFYASSNMGLILVGPLTDQRKKSLLAWAETQFGSKVFKSKEVKRPDRADEQEIRSSSTFKKMGFDVKSPSLMMAIRVPDFHHPDIAALDLLSGILGMGESSRLYQKLFVDQSAVTDVSAGLYVPKDAGLLYFQIDTNSVEQIAPANQMLLDELIRIQTDGPSATEIGRVLTNAESERLYATQSADGLASRIGFLKFVAGDLSYDQAYLNSLRSVTPEQVKEIAKKYFDYRRMAGVLMLPLANKDYDVSVIQKQVEATLKPKGDAVAPVKSKSKAAVKKGPYQLPLNHWERKSGIQVAHVERPDSHVVSFHLSALGGIRFESQKNWGLSHLMAMTWSKGTEKRDSRSIAQQIEGMAAGLNGFSGRNSVGLQMTGLAKDFGKLKDVLVDVSANSKFPGTEVAHSKRVIEDSLKSIEDHSSQLCTKLFLETLFGEHPYSKLTLGTLETMSRLDSTDLSNSYRSWWKPERLTVSVAGKISAKEIDSLMDDMEAELSRQKLTPSAAPEISNPDFLRAPRLVEKMLNREQTHIITGGLGLSLDSADRDAMKVLQTILGGQSGRLFIELREKKSLCYTVSPMMFEGIDTGYVGTYIGCSPEKKQDALQGIRKVYEDLAKKGPTANELARAKELYLGNRAMELQSDHSLAAYFGLERLYGFSKNETQSVTERIKKVTVVQVKTVIEKYYLKPNLVTAIVG